MYVEAPLKTEEFDFTRVEVIETPVVVEDLVLTVLEKALAKLRKPGVWIKGALHRRVENPKTGRGMYGYCMVGALNLHTQNTAVRREAERFLLPLLPKGFDDVPEFNDDPHTRLEDVERVFEKAIRKRRRLNAGRG